VDADAAGETPVIRVLIADDHAMFRQGVVEMLGTAEEIEVVGEAANGERAAALAKRLDPDVVLLDVDMPLMGAEEVMRRMLEDPPKGARSPGS
jgi:DNA-binding NarL/FixJ family response regulator